jgi:Ferritin-like
MIPERHDLDWLKGALRTAVAIEHSTLPLYLSAMFSLRVQTFTA